MTAYNLSAPGESQIFNGQTEISPAEFVSGQSVKLQCVSPSIGSDPNTDFRWRMYSANLNSMTTFNPATGMQDMNEAEGSTSCQYSRTGWVIYNTTSVSIHLECYLYNPSLGSSVYETPEDERPTFYIQSYRENQRMYNFIG